MQDDEAEATRLQRRLLEIGAREARDRIGDGLVGVVQPVPFEQGARQFERLARRCHLRRVAIAGIDARIGSEHAGEMTGLHIHGAGPSRHFPGTQGYTIAVARVDTRVPPLRQR